MNFLLYAIKCEYPGLNSSISMAKGEKGPTGKMNKFEYSAAYLTPWDPVSKKRNTNRKSGASEISNTYGGGVQVLTTGEKQGRGSIGVELCYYKHDEFKAMYKELLDDLLEWINPQKMEIRSINMIK